MDFENWQKINELFDEALAIAPHERAGFVASVEDAEIKNELESLLKSHDSSNKFLNKNAVEMSAKTWLENDSAKLVGSQIGRFKIIKEIGRGGMGAVYLAERTGADFTQKAAIKLIKRGMDTDFIVRRFQTERRILSRLNHPFIAKLLDGGTTSDGLPYFVMEYVEGENLKDHCRRLSTGAKLKLFRQICEAVQYAHRNLVVHRDLKPSNIIICEDGTPKLLDFGIAKVLDPETESEKTTTEFRLLTPKYASPEQMRGEIVDTQSDVYSLGVLLREILEELELPKPGTQKSRTATQNTKTAAELKTIISKAAHETAARRYASVEQLSEDLRRYETGLPILAQADSVSYRAQKFFLRHRAGVFAACLILLTLLGGIAATLWQFRQTRAERRLAEQRFNDVRGLASSVIFDLHDEIQNLPGSTRARKLLIEKALEYLNKLERDAGNDAGLRHELAMAYTKIADVQGQAMEASLLQSGEAEKNYRKALELEEKAVAAAPGNYEFRRDLALICYRFAEALRYSNNSAETLALERRAVETYESLTKERPDDYEVRRRWLVARSSYADALRESGNLAESIPLYEQNLKDTLAAAAAAPDDIKLNNFRGIAYGAFSLASFQNGETEKALALSLEIEKIAPAPSAENTYVIRNRGVFCEGISKIYAALGRFDEAERYAREGVGIMEKIAADDPENLEANYDVASLHNTYADLLEKQNRWQEAFAHRRKSLDAIAPLEKNEDNPDLYTADFFEFYAKFARAAAKTEHRDLGAKYAAKAENLNFEIEKTTGEVRNLYTGSFIALGEVFADLGEQEKGQKYFQKAVETWRDLQAAGRLYPNQTKNLSAATEKLK